MKNRGWIVSRIEKLPDTASTAEVRSVLKVTDATLRAWAANPYCKCVSSDGRNLTWHKEALRLWIIAVAQTGNRKRLRHGINPPISRNEARRMLGMPEDGRGD